MVTKLLRRETDPIPPTLNCMQACMHTCILLERMGEISQANIYTVLQRTIKLYEL